jgi:predicted Holliday junction resolvase-like endonuclease
MFKLIFWGIIIYLIYKFVFELVLPVSKATSQMQQKIKEMQETQQRQTQQTQQQTAAQPKSTTSPRSDEYIDYEEVK